MELYYNTESGRFELYREVTFELIGGMKDYLVYWKVGQEWETDCAFIGQEVLEDALTMGVLRPATADEARVLDLELA